MREILFPLRWIYQSVTGLRNWAFDHGLRRAQTVEAKVISVGNVTVGGTGKTPVTLALLSLLHKRDLSCGVVSRGYKRSKKGVFEVTLEADAATQFGDEPTMIKQAHPDVPIWVGERKVSTARQMLSAKPVKFVIADDAFQHRTLKRDLNLLLLDATEDMKNYRVMPVGRARESLLPALRRADYFVLTKTNLAGPDQVKDLIFWVKDKSDKPVLLAPFAFNGFVSAAGLRHASLRDPIYLVSGVARPETIEKLIEGKGKIVKHKIFEDHHKYTHLEIEAILDEASKLQARWIVTTAKDATKLKAFHSLSERLWIIDFAVQFEGDLNTFYADIDRLAGEHN